MAISRTCELDHEPIDDGRFEFLERESKKFCHAVGLHEDMILRIYLENDDWSFIMKIDALLEMAAKEVIRRSFKLTIGTREIRSDKLDSFVDSLPMNGRASLTALLGAAGCPAENVQFIEAIRRIRNAYAHDIRQTDVRLFDLIMQRSDKTHLLKNICAVEPENYDEECLVRMCTAPEGRGLLRFGVVDETMRFLILAYHVVLK